MQAGGNIYIYSRMDGKGTPAITDYYTPVYVDASILMSQVLLDHLT